MDAEAKRDVRKKTWQRFAFGVNTGVALLLALLLVGLLNYLSFRHYKRYDFSARQFYHLSEKSLGVLSTVTQRMDVIVFFQPRHEAYADVANLLDEYRYVCPYLHVDFVDPDRDPARTKILAGNYGIDEPNVIVFDAGDHFQVVHAGDLVEYDYSRIQAGKLPEITAFKGEQVMTSAIQAAIRSDKPVVYFLQGHGERDPRDHDPHQGYSEIARAIIADNAKVATIRFGEDHAIPPDCALLILAGMQHPLSQPELDRIETYLNGNGRLLVLLDARTETGLEPLLADWGVQIGNDVVVDATRTLSGRELYFTKYGDHPITHKLDGLTSIMYMPRSIRPLESDADAGEPADRPHAVVLAASSESGWAERGRQEGVLKYDPAEDIPGPVPVAVAVEKGPVPGIDVQIRSTRMVIFGDSDFVSNGGMVGGNRNLFMNALNWLLERDELIAIEPQPIVRSRLVMDNRQVSLLFYLVVAALPAAAGLLGILVWLRRRR